MLGPSNGKTVAGSIASAQRWSLEYELLDATDVARRWPTFTPAADDVAVYERRAGFVRPEATVAAQLHLARQGGADLHFNEAVTGWDSTDAGIEVTTDVGHYGAARLVLSPGAWAPQLLAPLGLPLIVERHVQFWFRSHVPIEQFSPDRHPIYVWEGADGVQAYGFPALGKAEDGVKAAFFRRGTPTGPDELQRVVTPDEAAPLLEFLSTRIPALGPAVCAAVPCMYTTTPDEHFILGFAPGDQHVVVCSPCSGHGFKFVPVIGEVVADLVASGGTRFDISLFDPARFHRTSTPTER
jgi:sarcosine oxidase